MWETYENVQQTSLEEGAGVGPETGAEQETVAGTRTELARPLNLLGPL